MTAIRTPWPVQLLRLRRVASLWLSISIAAASLAASEASAATYVVDVCNQDGGPGADISVASDSVSAGFTTRNTCGAPTPSAGISQSASAATLVGGITWTLSAPPGTKIQELTGGRVGLGTWDAGVVWELKADDGVLASVDRAVGAEEINFQALDASSIVSHLFCPAGPCVHQPNNQTFIRIGGIAVTMEDRSAPTPPGLGGSLLGGGIVSGTREVTFRATDLGSGIAEASLQIDGATVATKTDSNGGKCVKPYRAMQPCSLSIDSSFSVDTRKLANGDHKVQVSVVDAAGGVSTSAPATFTADTTPPVLAAVTLSRARFKVGRAVAGPRRGVTALRGTTLRFSSSEPGSLSVAVLKVGKKASSQIGVLARRIGAGHGRLAFSGQIGHKALRPGRYALSITATDAAGNVSKPKTLSFVVLPP